MIKEKKAMLKKMIKGCHDGAGGLMGSLAPSASSRSALSANDAAFLAPYKNAYYKRAKAAGAFARMAKLTGLGRG